MMIFLGVDVSKKKLDVTWLRDPQGQKIKSRKFDNTPKGFEELIRWATKNTGAPMESLQFTMEATGIYHEALAYALHQAGAVVAVVNPANIKHYAESFGRRSKTDKKDSVVIARYGATQQPRRWQPEAEEIRVLKALIARLEALETDIQREQNRMEKAHIAQTSGEVVRSIESVLEHLEGEKKRLLEQIDDHIDRHPGLKADKALLRSIPGVGPVISQQMMAMLRSRDFQSASQVGAYLGLVPLHHESGSSVKRKSRIAKNGHARLRAKLYMAAVVAIQHNPLIRGQYERLLKRGKCKMLALIAAMRKLVHICFGVIKHQQPFSMAVTT